MSGVGVSSGAGSEKSGVSLGGGERRTADRDIMAHFSDPFLCTVSRFETIKCCKI